MDRGFLAAVFLLLTAAALTAPFLPSAGTADLDGYTAVDDVEAGGNVLALEAGCYRLEMIVSSEQTEAIRRGLLNVTARRPLTHDLFAATLSEAGVELEAVTVDSLVDGTFHASLLVRGNRMQQVDARPSDATALAVRTGTPIHVDDTLLQEEAVDTCERGGDTI